MTTYTLSYYRPTRTARLVRRPWWNLFGRDRVELVDSHERVAVWGINKRGAELLQTTDASDILGIAVPGIKMLQLESGAPATAYVPTSGVEAQVTNLMRGTAP